MLFFLKPIYRYLSVMAAADPVTGSVKKKKKGKKAKYTERDKRRKWKQENEDGLFLTALIDGLV